MSIASLTQTSLPPEPTTPYPPRFRWLKRGAAAFLVGAALLGGLRWWWGWIADRRMRAEIDAIHARGEPALPADFVDPPLDDADNAALYIKQAIAGIVPVPGLNNIDKLPGDTFTPTELQIEASFIAANRAQLALVRRASDCPRAAWGGPTIFPAFNQHRDLSNRLAEAALYDHQTGDDAEAVKMLRDVVRLGDAQDQGSPLMVTHLVAMGIGGLGTWHTLTLAPVLSVGGKSATGATGNAATAAEVRPLIDALLDDRVMRDALVHVSWGERANIPAFASQLPLSASPVHPALELGSVRAMHAYEDCAKAAAAADYPTALALLTVAPNASARGALWDASHVVERIQLQAINRFFRAHFLQLTRRRAAAVALALRLYQADHGGKLPATLDELVPSYLPAIPLDPFAAGGKPLHYIRGPVPRIYSVGENGVDDGGSRKSTSPNPRHLYLGDLDRLDLVFRLTGPTTQPSSEAGDDEGD